ncbi:hypothetical protein J2752_000492 [Halarchaeum rubridurum]|uniref:Uncharacterized protein n=1 Tax=Halarchaeum rubridurum TaxID=489911 RepID=A0A830FYU5_9EURY|nr:hypothetical protein [Halarchaeum rubridurum]MBP1953611.1 hypothetical protein [Halarchaeum rubridurum]GGM63928.1 hypothetical protein GCM10009017_12520 [Halarchaeum rubridurum]
MAAADTPSTRPDEVHVNTARHATKTEHWDRSCQALARVENVATKPATTIPQGYYPKCQLCTDEGGDA